ncbi:hypothetical protein CYV26_12225 [Carnobacterium maltaromaticum]|nr:hypothetical protein CYV33_12210 [Carnobacterium maltaromaticum]PLS35845.1 hypothetical protein CYV30_09035 [Carnobacterium maltaromaticum]PLS36295.1 hypothetical protein CYV31_09040 [Carnobacterium maltaromaticum]PLS42752.1 hypothetical protein CYV27_12210 [Carnobacterium maltaromaticum]PLS42988.1 hypothetical protein CYV28_09050 [Carnobacterium maltaromaticum]
MKFRGGKKRHIQFPYFSARVNQLNELFIQARMGTIYLFLNKTKKMIFIFNCKKSILTNYLN